MTGTRQSGTGGPRARGIEATGIMRSAKNTAITGNIAVGSGKDVSEQNDSSPRPSRTTPERPRSRQRST